MKKTFLLPFAFLLLAVTSFKAQTVELEKTYELSKKSAKGVLKRVTFENDKYTLIYVTKATEQKVKFETYEFDKDFNFINMTPEELNNDVARKRLTIGKKIETPDTYSRVFATAGPNMLGTLVIEIWERTYRWNWEYGGYLYTDKQLNKIKPKGEEGAKYQLISSFTDGATGDMICLVIYKPGAYGKDGKVGEMDAADYKLLRISKTDGAILKEKIIDNQYTYQIALTRLFSSPNPENEEEELVSGCGFVLAPTEQPKAWKQFENPKNNEFMYMEVSSNLDIEVKKTFEVVNAQWRIDELVRDGDKNVYLFGPALEPKNKYMGYTMAAETKFKAVQLAKLNKNGEKQYCTFTDLAQFEKTAMKPASQKKSPEYTGKKFKILDYNIAPNKDFLVTGQNFETGKITKYTDVMVFHFDKDGNLKANYGIDKLTKSDPGELNPMPTVMLGGDNASNMYLLMKEIDAYNKAGRALTYARLAQVKTEGKGISDVITLGMVKDDPKYYLDENFPFLSSSNGKIVFFGSDKKGRNIWFNRVKLD
ncbi:MAG: hypothetical protein K0S33_4115 [Bacteroidetes bacterium]|jgi:hypothetical protein|nr:hypothetical protein [Bacteroidota bacterium]